MSFNKRRFVAAISMIDKKLVTSISLDDILPHYEKLRIKIKEAFGRSSDDVNKSVSLIADRIMETRDINKKYTTIVELFVLIEFLEEILDELRNRSHQGTTDIQDIGRGRVYSNPFGWKQGSVRHSGNQRKSNTPYTM